MLGSMAKGSEVERVGRFGLVGITNALIDFGIYNALTLGGRSLVGATYISGTVAMIFSFFANRYFVFKSHDQNRNRQLLVFFLVTAFAVWVIQPVMITLLTKYWLTPLNLGVKLADLLHITKFLSPDFLRKNGAKAAGVLVGLVWNYGFYRSVVFKK